MSLDPRCRRRQSQVAADGHSGQHLFHLPRRDGWMGCLRHRSGADRAAAGRRALVRDDGHRSGRRPVGRLDHGVVPRPGEHSDRSCDHTHLHGLPLGPRKRRGRGVQGGQASRSRADGRTREPSSAEAIPDRGGRPCGRVRVGLVSCVPCRSCIWRHGSQPSGRFGRHARRPLHVLEGGPLSFQRADREYGTWPSRRHKPFAGWSRSGMGRSTPSDNRGFLMPYPRTAQQDGHAPICQQCHEDSREVGSLSANGMTATAAPAQIARGDGGKGRARVLQ